ncbi:hypothetical protein EAF04_005533 [Stromatinia cepivora]|nr:hypothetical protein EAF04_005533 [Stromatinia cepivora]
MTAHDYYSRSPQTVPGPGILKPTTGYPTSTYHQQPQSDIPGNQQPENPPPAVYNSQGYSAQQPYYPPQQQIAEYNHQPQPYNYQTPNQPSYHRDEHRQYPAVERQSSQQLPPHLRPRRSISEPPDPRYLAHHIPGYHHRGRSRSPSYYSSSERSLSRSRNRAHSHSRARSTRSLSRPRHRHSHSHSRPRHSRPSRARARHNHKDRNAFLGAIGGGAIGDLIMPGLGTLGGALLGGVGGREVSRNGQKNEKSGGKEGRRIFGGSRKTYDQEWREGRIERGEISE